MSQTWIPLSVSIPQRVNAAESFFHANHGIQGPFHWWSYSPAIRMCWKFHFALAHTTTKFCTCYDRYAVVACAKTSSDLTNNYWNTAKHNFLEIWILRQKLNEKVPRISSIMRLGGINWNCNPVSSRQTSSIELMHKRDQVKRSGTLLEKMYQQNVDFNIKGIQHRTHNKKEHH